MAVIAPKVFGQDYIAWGRTSLDAISNCVASDGVISPAINAYNSPGSALCVHGICEGQAWALMLYAAHKAWKEAENRA
jgi:hypothetical protein